jgi:hypothetical protein
MLSIGVIADSSLGCNMIFSNPSSVLNASLVVHFIVLFGLRPVYGLGLPFVQSSYPFCYGILVHPPIPPLALTHYLAPPYAQAFNSPHYL